jgi:RNA polymerase sigma factor (sigma-70 family)
VTRRQRIVADGASDLRRLERAAAALLPLEREILMLSAGQGLRNAQIAAKLGMGERRVQQILARALRKFDSRIGEPAPRWWRFWES